MLKTRNLKYDTLLCECRYQLSEMEGVVMHHVFREQNQVADALAKEGKRRSDYGNTTLFIVSSTFVDRQHQANILGTSYVKKLNNATILFSSG